MNKLCFRQPPDLQLLERFVTATGEPYGYLATDAQYMYGIQSRETPERLAELANSTISVNFFLLRTTSDCRRICPKAFWNGLTTRNQASFLESKFDFKDPASTFQATLRMDDGWFAEEFSKLLRESIWLQLPDATHWLQRQTDRACQYEAVPSYLNGPFEVDVSEKIEYHVEVFYKPTARTLVCFIQTRPLEQPTKIPQLDHRLVQLTFALEADKPLVEQLVTDISFLHTLTGDPFCTGTAYPEEFFQDSLLETAYQALRRHAHALLAPSSLLALRNPTSIRIADALQLHSTLNDELFQQALLRS